MKRGSVLLLGTLNLLHSTHSFPSTSFTSCTGMVASRRSCTSAAKTIAAAASIPNNLKTPPPRKVAGRSTRREKTVLCSKSTKASPDYSESSLEAPNVVTPSVASLFESSNGRNATTVATVATGASSSSSSSTLLFSLHDNVYNDPLVRAKLIARPSKRNRSPYVADVWLEDEQREAIAHVPNLDMGGKCVPGATILVKAARTPKGIKVGCNAVSPKYGTPKCEFITQLLHVDESTIHPSLYPAVWVGAHPSLGERIAEECLKRNLLGAVFADIDRDAIQQQIRNPCGADMRSDFCVTHTTTGTKRIIEVKTVVDTDYAVDFVPSTKVKCLFTSDQKPYTRTAIFPWGNSKQKGPDLEPVVSARAIHHVQELTRIATGELTDHKDGERYKAAVVFVVIRGDAQAFRPNVQACPSFGKYLRAAVSAGVEILVKQVSWGTGDEEGQCFVDDQLLPLEWPIGL